MYSGLIAIPEEVIEAARIDGAKSFRIIRAIHLPPLAGQFKPLIVLALIGIIQDFGSILIVTGGGLRTRPMYLRADVFCRNEIQ